MEEISVGTEDESILCTIKTKEKVNTQSEFTVKGLASIQVLCIQQSTRNDPNFKNMLKILTRCVKDIEELYYGKQSEPDPLEEYNY